MKSICIIGSGLCGGYILKEFKDTINLKIKVIDLDSPSKKFIRKEKLKNIYINNHENLSFYDKIIRAYGFGGNSNYWHGGLTEFEDLDLKKIDNYLKSNFSKKLKKYYNKIWFSLNEKKIFNLKLKFNSLYLLFKNSNNFYTKKIFIQKNPFNSRSILKDLKKNKNFEFYENSICLNINKSNNNNKINSITILKDGEKKEITSDYFILSAGSFETPRILLESIKNGNLNLINNNIGKNLIDHPFLKIGEIYNKNKKKVEANYFNEHYSKNLNLRVAFSFEENFQNYKLNHSIVLRPHVSNEIIEFKNFLKKYLNEKKYYYLFKFVLKNIININLIFKILLIHLTKRKNIIDVFLHLDQHSSQKNKISLSDYKDKFNRTIPKVIFGNDQDEKNTINKSVKLLISLFKYSSFEFNLNKKKLFFYHGNHFSGTARISPNDKLGVVDNNLKVHGLSNLYICDSSVIPFFGNSNPVFTLMALCKMLTDSLKQKIK